ncbi:MAG: type II toxin-antitoxin system HicA family toxin [Isosphaeraceae bacterium]
MSRRDKLLEFMRSMPGEVRFTQLRALLRYEGFEVVNIRGSHFTYQHDDGRLLVVVRPHGKHKTCHPRDVRKVLEALGR